MSVSHLAAQLQVNVLQSSGEGLWASLPPHLGGGEGLEHRSVQWDEKTPKLRVHEDFKYELQRPRLPSCV
jgi:hypothetical protein